MKIHKNIQTIVYGNGNEYIQSIRYQMKPLNHSYLICP